MNGVKCLAWVKPFPRDERATVVPSPTAAGISWAGISWAGVICNSGLRCAEIPHGYLPPSPGCFHYQQLPGAGPKHKQEPNRDEHVNSDMMSSPGHSYPPSAAAQGGEQTLLSTALQTKMLPTNANKNVKIHLLHLVLYYFLKYMTKLCSDMSGKAI